MNPRTDTTDRDDVVRAALAEVLTAEAAEAVRESPAFGALATNLAKAAVAEGTAMTDVLADTVERCREEWGVDGNDFDDWLAHRANTPAAFLASRVGDR